MHCLFVILSEILIDHKRGCVVEVGGSDAENGVFHLALSNRIPVDAALKFASVKASTVFAVINRLRLRNCKSVVNQNLSISFAVCCADFIGVLACGGEVVKTGSGTLVMNPYGTSMSGAFTVEGGTLNIANDGATGSGAITVKNGAILEVAGGSTTGTGAVTVESGATLAPSGTGVATVGGNLTLNDGACLAFNYTDRSNVTKLAIASGKTVTAGGTVKVKVSAAAWPKIGNKVLTTGGRFTGVNVTLDETDKPKWAERVEVVDGDLVLVVKPKPMMLFVR